MGEASAIVAPLQMRFRRCVETFSAATCRKRSCLGNDHRKRSLRTSGSLCVQTAKAVTFAMVMFETKLQDIMYSLDVVDLRSAQQSWLFHITMSSFVVLPTTKDIGLDLHEEY